MDLEYYKRVLEKARVVFAHGLSRGEIQQLEEEYQFRFPPDLRDFLTFALPVSKGFIDWRQVDREEILESLSWPYEGMCFDIEHNSFWLEEWGPKPTTPEKAFEIARKAVDSAPVLIPIYGHRYIPDQPHEHGNPIFSVWQTDIICYGSHLANYLENEFRYYFGGIGEYGLKLDGEVKHIEFWSQLAE